MKHNEIKEGLILHHCIKGEQFYIVVVKVSNASIYYKTELGNLYGADFKLWDFILDYYVIYTDIFVSSEDY